MVNEHRKHAGLIVAVGDALVRHCADYRRAMLVFKRTVYERDLGHKIDPERLAKMAGAVDDTLLAYAARLAETGVKVRSDAPPATEERASPEFKSTIENADHVLHSFLEDVRMGAMFLVSSKSALYLKDVTCASAGVTPKPGDGFRTIIGFDKSNGSVDHATNTLTPSGAHPPAVMANVLDYTRRVIWMNQQMPGVGISQAKVDISSAFKHVGVALSSVNRVATQLGGRTVTWPTEEEVLEAVTARSRVGQLPREGSCDSAGPVDPATVAAVRDALDPPVGGYGGFGSLVVVGFYLCLPFGWNVSPANYTVFGHTQNSTHCTRDPQRKTGRACRNIRIGR